MHRHITGSAAFAACCIAIACGSSFAGEYTATTAANAKPNGEIAVGSAPRPVQNEPMVAPVKRTPPQMPVVAGKPGDAGKPSCAADTKPKGNDCVKVSETEAAANKPVTITGTKTGSKRAH